MSRKNPTEIKGYVGSIAEDQYHKTDCIVTICKGGEKMKGIDKFRMEHGTDILLGPWDGKKSADTETEKEELE